MKTFPIECADCKHHHVAHSPKAKYCNVCRIFRDLAFVNSTTKPCFMCGDQFAPMSRKDMLCSKCDYTHLVHGTGDCGLCKATSTSTIRSDIAVCLDCARDPKKRQIFSRAIAKKRAERMEAS